MNLTSLHWNMRNYTVLYLFSGPILFRAVCVCITSIIYHFRQKNKGTFALFPFLFFKQLLQIWLCPQGEVGKAVFAAQVHFSRGRQYSQGSYLHCNWLLAGQDSCFNLNQRQLLWRWLIRNRSC